MRRSVWIGAAVLWTVFIWSNSLQTAAESSANSQGVLSMLMPLLEGSNIPEDTWHTLIRKVAHMAEFALLALLWSNGLGSRDRFRSDGFSDVVCVLFLCLLTALADETIQLSVAGRSGELRDVWIDLGGSAIGCGAAGLIRRFKKR